MAWPDGLDGLWQRALEDDSTVARTLIDPYRQMTIADSATTKFAPRMAVAVPPSRGPRNGDSPVTSGDS